MTDTRWTVTPDSGADGYSLDVPTFVCYCQAMARSEMKVDVDIAMNGGDEDIGDASESPALACA